MGRRVSKTAFAVYLSILFGMVFISSMIDRLSNDSVRVFANFVLLAVCVIIVLIVFGVVLPRREAARTERARQEQPGKVAVRGPGAVPSRKRQWRVVIVCLLVIGGLWTATIGVGMEIEDQGVEPMMLYQIPFLTAFVTTVGIGTLGPLRYPGEIWLTASEWLPLALLVVIAVLGVFLIPAVAIWFFDTQVGLSTYKGALLPGFVVFPVVAALIRFSSPARGQRREPL